MVSCEVPCEREVWCGEDTLSLFLSLSLSLSLSLVSLQSPSVSAEEKSHLSPPELNVVRSPDVCCQFQNKLLR